MTVSKHKRPSDGPGNPRADERPTPPAVGDGKRVALGPAGRLLRDGYVVARVYSPAATREMQSNFVEACKSFPEFVPGATHYVGGSFGAFGTPGSFHNPFVRELRFTVMAELLPIFEELVHLSGKQYVMQCFDRMCIRRKGTTMPSESPHRDESPMAGLTIGGWLAVKEDQQFRCSPGSHGDGSGRGFQKLTPEEAAEYKSKMSTVRVPVGSVLLFVEDIVHCVSGANTPADMYRVFTGWNLSNSRDNAIEDTDKICEEQAVPLIKSGQKAPMWPRLYLTNHPEKLAAITEQVKPEYRTQHTFKTGARAGKTIEVVERFMPSLAAMDQCYKPYSAAERIIMKPSTIAEIRDALSQLRSL